MNRPPIIAINAVSALVLGLVSIYFAFTAKGDGQFDPRLLWLGIALVAVGVVALIVFLASRRRRERP
jgi:uncharacterized membrane protein